jgi:hypothetical protein
LKPSALISKLITALAPLAISTASIAFGQPVPAPAAAEMACVVGVVTGKDLLAQAEGSDPTTTTQVISLPIVDGEGDQEFQINGQTVAVMMYKKEFADLYHVDVLLLTPKADLPTRGPQVNASIKDYLVNEGPAKDNGWTIKPGPNATKYDYLLNQGGAFAFSNKLQKVLKAEGKWGTYPYSSVTTHVNNMYYVAEEVQALLKAGKIAESDVLGIYTAFTCTLNK